MTAIRVRTTRAMGRRIRVCSRMSAMERHVMTAMVARNRIRAKRALAWARVPWFVRRSINAMSRGHAIRPPARAAIRTRPMERRAMTTTRVRNRIRVNRARAPGRTLSSVRRWINVIRWGCAIRRRVFATIRTSPMVRHVRITMGARRRTRVKRGFARGAIPSSARRRINATLPERAIHRRAYAAIRTRPMVRPVMTGMPVRNRIRVNRARAPGAIRSSAQRSINATMPGHAMRRRVNAAIRTNPTGHRVMTAMRARKWIPVNRALAPGAI